ncbi:MAG TPA: LysM peptidoglycan-binding domain-containing protein [Verrucomicrobiae bacterium]|nr:LysM peptidoglycan-binding domain-containing protein [Verrucomicrobiae bacterium]
MNHPNPFIPQGSVLEQNKRRSRMKLAVFCVLAVSVCGLTAMLIQGCKREQENPVPPETSAYPAIETSAPPVIETSAVPAVVTSAPPVAPAVIAPPPSTVAPVAPFAPAAQETTEYTVVKGDTLSGIAKAKGVSLKALEAANPTVVPTKLQVGKKLIIPAGSASAPATMESATGMNTGGETYVVKPGDNLSKIAREHDTTVKALQAENNLTTTMIKVGDKLKIPAKAGAAAPVPVPTPGEVPVPPVAPPASTTAPSNMSN